MLLKFGCINAKLRVLKCEAIKYKYSAILNKSLHPCISLSSLANKPLPSSESIQADPLKGVRQDEQQTAVFTVSFFTASHCALVNEMVMADCSGAIFTWVIDVVETFRKPCA